MRALLLALLAGFAAWRAYPSDAVVAWDETASMILVAHDARIEAFDGDGLRRLWTVEGLPHPSMIVVSPDGATAALIDPLSNRAILVNVPSGKSRALTTGATPIDGQFVGSTLYLLDRDAAEVERFGADPSRAHIAVAADPVFMRRSGRFLYVYSRSGGALHEIDPSSDRVVRSVQAAASASDMELDGSYAYLVHPQRGRIEVIDLRTMRAAGEIAVGAVPTDLAFIREGTAITARRFAVADPAAKRIWQLEGAESQTKAIARGFLRGLIGLRLYSGRHDDYPTGIDRLLASGTTLLAYDSSGRTLYAEVRGKPIAIATSIGPASFAITSAGVVVWENGGLHRKTK